MSELDELRAEVEGLRARYAACAQELDDERAKVGLMMQPTPETTPESSVWIMLQQWVANRDVEKRQERERSAKADAELVEARAEAANLRTVLRRIEKLVDCELTHDLNMRCHLGDHVANLTEVEAHEIDELLSSLYRWTHGMNTEHSCHHVHEDWRQEALGPTEHSQ